MAQQVPTDPTSSHIFPAGGRRGETIAVRVGGECLPPSTRFRLEGPGVSAPDVLGKKLIGPSEPSPRRKPSESPIFHPTEWESSIAIEPTAELGPRFWRLSCARGGTGARPFVVGDLPEFIESESNSKIENAESVTLPVTINGRIFGERDLDWYRFSARKGEVVVAEVVACRLGSPLEPIVEFRDAEGKSLAAGEIKLGGDPVLALAAPADGEYRLLVGNLGVKGGPQYVYRVTLSTAPFPSRVFPAGGTAGTNRTLEFSLLSGRNEATLVTREVAFPPSFTGDWRWTDDAGGIRSTFLEVSDTPHEVEREENDDLARANPLVWPRVVEGQFLSADDEDWYSFSAKQGELLSFVCSRFPTSGLALPIVSVHDANGGPLFERKAIDSLGGIVDFEGRAPADGAYFARVRDLQQGIRGGRDFAYRLTVGLAKGDFDISSPTDFANVLPGARAELDLQVRRRGGFADPIDLKIEGLPAGITFEPARIEAGVEACKLAFVAAADAATCDVSLRIEGVASILGETRARRLQATTLAHDAAGVGVGATSIDNVRLTVRHKPPFRLFCNEAYQYAYRGTRYPYLMEVERFDGFNGPIHLEVADRQIKDLDGVEVIERVIPAGESKIMLPLYLPETMHINVQAHSNIYAQGWIEFEDRWGVRQSMSHVSEMRCMIRPLPTVVKLKVLDRELEATPGEVVHPRLALERTSNFDGPMRIELYAVHPRRELVVEPVSIAAGETSAEISVRLPDSMATEERLDLVFRGVGDLPDQVQVISEDRATLTVKAPAGR